jgi:hypothetical protein
LALREERRLRVFENRMLRRIFGPKRDEVTGEWRQRTEELNDLSVLTHYGVDDKIENNEMGRACSAVGGGRDVYSVWVGKLEGKRSPGRPRRSWEDNIKIDLQEVGCGGWTGLSWLRIGTGIGHL